MLSIWNIIVFGYTLMEISLGTKYFCLITLLLIIFDKYCHVYCKAITSLNNDAEFQFDQTIFCISLWRLKYAFIGNKYKDKHKTLGKFPSNQVVLQMKCHLLVKICQLNILKVLLLWLNNFFLLTHINFGPFSGLHLIMRFCRLLSMV